MAKRKTKTLRDLIADAVVESELSLTKWCQANGLNPRLIYRWREGDVGTPQMRPMAALAKALGVDYAVAEAAVEAAKKG